MAHKTSAMVEAGIMAAIAIVFALINMYVPFVGMFLNFIWPLPIILCGMRHGMRWSIMTLLVAGAIIAILISPLHSFTLVAVFGLLGVVLGECMRRRLPPLRLLAVGSVAAFLSLMISLLISILIMGINPLSMFFETFDKSLIDAVEFYQKQGMSEEEIEYDGGFGWGMFAIGCAISAIGFAAGVAAKATGDKRLGAIGRGCTVAGGIISAVTVVGIAASVIKKTALTTCQVASGAYTSSVGVSDLITGYVLW